MSDAPDTNERLAAFGRWLARERELRGLARDRLVQATRLAPGVVEALESGEEGRMPPRAYAVGYLRAYAAALGLDGDEVLLRFEEAMGPAAAGRRRPRRGAPYRALGALLLGGAIAAGVLWALLRS